jgi:putative transcriptional regulator
MPGSGLEAIAASRRLFGDQCQVKMAIRQVYLSYCKATLTFLDDGSEWDLGGDEIMLDFRLGNRLKVARAEKALSQEQLALLAGVTRQTISSIETGQYNPSALLALLLARRLDKRVEDLFFLEEKA